MICSSIWGKRRPTQVPAPTRVLAAVSVRISRPEIEQTGSDSVAPYGVWMSGGVGEGFGDEPVVAVPVESPKTLSIRSMTGIGTGAPADSTRPRLGSRR